MDTVKLTQNASSADNGTTCSAATKPSPTTHSTNLTDSPMVDNQDKEKLRPNANVTQSYYADKDLAWWLQLARDFKSARQIPLPCDEGEEL